MKQVLDNHVSQRSLKKRLIVLVSGFVALLMIGMTMLVVWYMSQSLEEQVSKRLENEISATQRLLEQRIGYLQENTVLLTRNELVVNGLVDPVGRETYLPKLVENFVEGRDVISFSLVDYDGIPVFKTTEEVPDYNQFPELRRALAMNQMALFIEPSANSLIIVAPIEYYSTTQGAVVVEYDLKAVFARLLTVDPLAYYRLMVNGRQVVSLNYDKRQSYISESMASSVRLPLLNTLSVQIEGGLPKTVYMAPVWDGLQGLLFFSLLFIAIAVLVSAKIGNSIAKPILELHRRVVESVKSPELRCSPIGTHDELEVLASAFDHRTDLLMKTQSQLEEDVAQRLKAQKEVDDIRHYLQNIIDSMPSMLVAVDIDGRVTHWNGAAEQISGWSKGDAIGCFLGEVVPMLSKIAEHIKAAIKEKKPELLERVSNRGEGGVQYVDVMIYPLVGKEIGGAVVRVDDVTERVRMEQMMSQTEKMMSVGGLAAGMAHELNNPLGGILQGLQNIKRRLSPDLTKNRTVATELGLDLDKVHEYLQKREIEHFMDGISEAGSRASDIIENMLQFSRKTEIVFSQEDLAELIDRTIELASVDYDLKKSYDFRSIKIEREYESDLPSVPCVASEIQQVLLNLLRNAAQALYRMESNVKTRQIVVRTHHQKDKAYIEIEDNGPGMDEETTKRVFEPFFTTRPPGEGTGLGLSVSYFIIYDEHDGSIEVESKLGRGTKFVIELPIKSADEVARQLRYNR